tara:strand:+ start:204 stop:461 length:258 start_codon:yes stop_codon:yes gene_type:complete
MIKRKLTHEQHCEQGAVTSDVYRKLLTQTILVRNAYPMSSKVHKAAAKLLTALDTYKSALDSEYHAVTTTEQFVTSRHVYYGGTK